ncbi:ATP synthase alpha/beta family, nucleotide-binding domain-containing protein [Ditylenchus destructor]|nr:ATP synthase alpha/beta family, nucleotide-binding domain-containing protein [Ditylenchus destructor]
MRGAQKVLAGARDEGFAAGLAQGRAAAMEAVAEAVEAMTGAMGISRDQAVAAAREDVALLALQVARKLIGQLPEAEQLARLAQEAARQSMPDGEALRLRVHPSHEAEVRALLAATVGAAHWRVEGDAALPVTACRVGGAQGDVDAAIDVQLARVARGWGLEWPSGGTREDPLPRPLPQAGEGVIQPPAGVIRAASPQSASAVSSQTASAISLPLPLAGEGGGEGLPVPRSRERVFTPRSAPHEHQRHHLRPPPPPAARTAAGGARPRGASRRHPAPRTRAARPHRPALPRLRSRDRDAETGLRAEVVGYADGELLLAPSARCTISRSAPSCKPPTPAPPSPAAMRCSAASWTDSANPSTAAPCRRSTARPCTAPPPSADTPPVDHPFETGIRAIDATLTVGEGQRVGVFAMAGGGKSTLLGMLARNARADVNVIALIGERGREVREFIDDALGPRAWPDRSWWSRPPNARRWSAPAPPSSPRRSRGLPRAGPTGAADDGLGHPPRPRLARAGLVRRRAAGAAWLPAVGLRGAAAAVRARRE